MECSYPQILERMAECENHHGLTFRIRQRQYIQFALRVEASDLAVTREIFLPQDDRFTEENRHVAPRTFWSIGPFPYTACAPHIVQAMTRWSEALGTTWLVIPIFPENRSRMQHGQCWVVAAETPPPARELNLPQGKAFITPSEGQRGP